MSHAVKKLLDVDRRERRAALIFGFKLAAGISLPGPHSFASCWIWLGRLDAQLNGNGLHALLWVRGNARLTPGNDYLHVAVGPAYGVRASYTRGYPRKAIGEDCKLLRCWWLTFTPWPRVSVEEAGGLGA